MDRFDYSHHPDVGEMNDEFTILAAAVFSCSCLTMTPSVSAHAASCRYKALMKRLAEVQTARNGTIA